jgi:hypothetical protein
MVGDTNFRRQYNTSNRDPMVRKSTNPFLEDPISDAANSSEETPKRPPQRPPSSSKPSVQSAQPVSPMKPAQSGTGSTHHRRSNSDSSMLEAPPKAPLTKNSSHNLRHDHHSSSNHKSDKLKKDKESKSRSSKSRKKGQPLDVIDKLDVTGFFGPGSFHHDGPFDACNPHRNKNTKRAPVLAFPADGANNSLAGVGPNRDRYVTEDIIFGRGVEEAYSDFNRSSGATKVSRGDVDSIAAFNPALKEAPVHGDVTMGLGTSTFLDGTPASLQAISQSAQERTNGADGLGRKKSLVQRLRGGGGSVPVPSRRYNGANFSTPELSGPLVRTGSNNDPTSDGEKKTGVAVTANGVTSPPPPPPPSSSSSSSPTGGGGGGNGLLRRVKSLKVGGKRRGS